MFGDSGPVQLLTGFLYLISALFAMSTRKQSGLIWTLGGFFLVACSIDETFMFHECMKYTLFKGMHSFRFRDYMVFSYAVIALVGGGVFLKKYSIRKKEKILVLFSALAVVSILLIDVFGYQFTAYDDQIEESLEVMLSGLVFSFIFQKPKIKLINNHKQMIFFLIILFLGSGLAIRELLHPNVCPFIQRYSF